MVLFIAILYFVLFSYLAVKNFKAAVGFLILVLPSYFIRFNIGPLPTSVLEITFGSIFFVWIWKYSRIDWAEIKNFYQERKFFCLSVVAFFIFSILGIFTSNHHIQALGIWRAYFLEPILFFLILISRRKYINSYELIWFLSLSTISISVLAIMQKLTGQFYSPTLEVSELNGRVTSFFTTPNAIGLYVAPIIPLMIYGLKDEKRKNIYLLVILLALVGLFLSFSQGAWVALVVSAVLGLYLSGQRKLTGIFLLLFFLTVIFFNPLRENLLFKSQSGHNRLVLWDYTWDFLTKSPKNFVLGAGIKEWFERVQKPVNDFKKIEPLISPHNIFLNFWSEIGLFGALLFVFIYIIGVKEAVKKYCNNKIFGIILICALVIFLIHGMVDAPYFKNDLSFLWWVIAAIIFI